MMFVGRSNLANWTGSEEKGGVIVDEHLMIASGQANLIMEIGAGHTVLGLSHFLSVE